MCPLAPREHVDFLVLGGGVAGLSFALEAARHGSVLVLTKRQRQEGNTQYAQGGIAAVLGPDDDFALHVEDTLVAGAGLCHRDAVEVTVREGPERIRWLLVAGRRVRPGGADRLHLTREGGHSRRRVAHAKDTTGREIERALLAACDAARHPHRGGPGRHRPHHQRAGRRWAARTARSAPTCSTGPRAPSAPSPPAVTVLATGGAGKVYLYTSNPDVATGDGVAMAYRAGASVANMEFFQFHPTCLFHPRGQELPHLRGAARRGGHPAQQGGRGLHDRATTRARSWRRATSWPAPSTPR